MRMLFTHFFYRNANYRGRTLRNYINKIQNLTLPVLTKLKRNLFFFSKSTLKKHVQKQNNVRDCVDQQ